MVYENLYKNKKSRRQSTLNITLNYYLAINIRYIPHVRRHIPTFNLYSAGLKIALIFLEYVTIY